MPNLRPCGKRLHATWILSVALASAGLVACGSDSESAAPDTDCGEACTDDMVLIAAASFSMGSPTGEGTPREHPAHDVTVDQGFWLDRTEVTNAQFVEFLRAAGTVCAFDGVDYPCFECFEFSQHDLGFDCSVDGWPMRANCQAVADGPATTSCADHPVVLVTWSGARQYCEWRGKRLPSEAEWGLAANGADGDWRRFPWGDSCPETWNNISELSACAAAGWTTQTARSNCQESDCNDGFERTAPVGSFPAGASAAGVMDLAGNVLERVEDCYHPSYAGNPPTDGSAWNSECAAVPTRIGRSSGHMDPGASLRNRARTDDIAIDAADPDVGFRCARNR
ncbi:MAG: sulfatase modifying factor 1 [Myxococcota bacterium]|jgi:sulfatase modifying factor 1